MSEKFRKVEGQRMSLAAYHRLLEAFFREKPRTSYSAALGHMTERELRLVAQQPSIESLIFSGAVTPIYLCEAVAFRYLDRLPALRDVTIDRAIESLSVRSVELTDEGGRHFGRLRHLWYLNLYATQVGDATLKAMASFGGLECLYLQETSVGDEGVDAVRGLPRLRELNLADTWITRRSLETLSALPCLTHLRLAHLPPAGDLSPLQDFPSLVLLDLTDCELGATDLEALCGCTQLRNLELSFDGPYRAVTKTTFQRLLDELPNTYVDECRVGDPETHPRIERNMERLPA
jgi:hypothetical protein